MHVPKLSLTLYFLIALILAPFSILSEDTYYYWEWSRHLDFSYHDGPPMIAYFIKLSTLILGNTLFALGFIGILTTLITAWIIYKTGELFLDNEANYIAVILWLFTPVTTIALLNQTSYDGPLCLFWALTLFFTIKYIKLNQTQCLYFIGCSIGLMMLSKYSGIILVLGLLIFLLTSEHRYLLKKTHFYSAMLLAFILFTPVIFWNYKHEWRSFIYQLHYHRSNGIEGPLHHMSKSFFTVLLPMLNFLLIPPILSLKRQKDPVKLCQIICAVFFFFFLFCSKSNDLREQWMAPYCITGALLGGYCFQTFTWCRKPVFFIIGVYGIMSLGILIYNVHPFLTLSKGTKFTRLKLINQFNKIYPQIPSNILTSDWYEARQLFFLANKPNVYSISCNLSENQYELWSTTIKNKILSKTIKKAMYIGWSNQLNCVNKYFDRCEQLTTPSVTDSYGSYKIYAYQCENLA